MLGALRTEENNEYGVLMRQCVRATPRESVTLGGADSWSDLAVFVLGMLSFVPRDRTAGVRAAELGAIVRRPALLVLSPPMDDCCGYTASGRGRSWMFTSTYCALSKE